LIKQSKKVKDIFKAKKARRKKLANLSIEQKYRILLQLQRIATPILKSRGLEKKPWIPGMQFFQVDETCIMARDYTKSVSVTSKKEGFSHLSVICGSGHPKCDILNVSTDDADSALLKWKGL